MKRYLSLTEVAQRLGVTKGALARYKLPEPDVLVASIRGWSEQTIDDWTAARPGHGGRPRKTASREEVLGSIPTHAEMAQRMQRMFFPLVFHR